MADDMGFSDIGCYGSEIKTPNLDALAATGVRFTQFYNTARCCPTRAALMTGLYSHQAGVGHMMEDHSATAGPAYAGELSAHAVTIAQVLHGAGYRNYMAGKWHVTHFTKPASDADKANWPLQRGFDRYYGTIHGAGSFFDPNTLTRDNAYISPFNDAEYKPEQYYYTDAISDQASRFVKEHARDHAGQPFFLYVAYTAAHWPMHAKEKDIAKYKGKYDSGYEPVRAARLAKLKQLGIIDPRWEMTPQAGDWDAVKNKAWESRCMEVFAAMVDCMDQGIGRLMSTLKETRQEENTLVLFLQDNGGCAEPMGRAGPFKPRADAPTLPAMAADAVQPDMIPKQTRDGYPMRQGEGVMPGGADTFIGYGQAWANVSNTPFREYKHWEHEGGVSTPLIAHWPAGIPAARHGKLETQIGHLIDIMATCVDLSGAAYPKVSKGESVTPMEGASLVPAMRGQDMGQRTLYWEHEGNRAIRIGDWKLVSKKPGPWELYDMKADRSEMHDLVAQQPQRAEAMAARWQVWADRVGVHAWPLEPPQPHKKKGKARGKPPAE
jgi:arylsulfatase